MLRRIHSSRRNLMKAEAQTCLRSPIKTPCALPVYGALNAKSYKGLIRCKIGKRADIGASRTNMRNPITIEILTAVAALALLTGCPSHPPANVGSASGDRRHHACRPAHPGAAGESERCYSQPARSADVMVLHSRPLGLARPMGLGAGPLAAPPASGRHLASGQMGAAGQRLCLAKRPLAFRRSRRRGIGRTVTRPERAGDERRDGEAAARQSRNRRRWRIEEGGWQGWGNIQRSTFNIQRPGNAGKWKSGIGEHRTSLRSEATARQASNIEH